MHTEHVAFAQCMQLLDARFWIMLMNVENKNHVHHAIVHKHIVYHLLHTRGP